MQILLQAFSLIAIIIVGWALKRMGWVRAEDFRALSNIVMRITLPAAIIVNFNEVSLSLTLLSLAVVAVVVNCVGMAAGLLVHRRSGHRGQAFGILNMSSYNVSAFAIPYISGFLGPQAIVYAGIFDVGNAFSSAGVGYGAATARADSERRPSLWRVLTAMFRSPLFVTYLAMVLMRSVELSLPDSVIRFVEFPAAANTFLAMLMLGVGLEIVLERSKMVLAAKHLLVRYGLALVFTLVTWFLMPWPEDVLIVVCMLFWSPIASMVTAFTGEIRGDVPLSAFLNSASILVGLVAMPVVLIVLG